jgi:hypothetical protein
MAENIVIYAGLEKVGKMKKKAIEREVERGAARSVSDLVWTMFRKYGSPKLKADLLEAERLANAH